MRKQVPALAVLLCLTFLACGRVFAYLSAPFDAGYLLKQADVVCKVKVLSVARDGTILLINFRPPIETPRFVALVRTISVIKGAPADEFAVAFPRWDDFGGALGDKPRTLRISTPDTTDLTRGEITVLLLKGSSSPYEFVDWADNHGKLKAFSRNLRYGTEATPRDKLLAELLAYLKGAKGKDRIATIEQLGKLGNINAREVLRKQSASDNLAVRGQALISRVQIGDMPGSDELSSFLRLEPSQPVRADVRIEPWQIGGSLPNLQLTLLMEINISLGPGGSVPKLAPNFDYAAFCEQALQLSTIKENKAARAEIASIMRTVADKRSIPDLVALLDDSEQSVRYLAATGLANVNGRNDYYVSVDRFKADEAKYITYWKDWWNDRKG